MLLYLDAATLQEVLADVSTIVFNCMLIDELLAHDWSFLLKARGVFSFLWQKVNNILFVKYSKKLISNLWWASCPSAEERYGL